jgi:hypothetical protein
MPEHGVLETLQDFRPLSDAFLLDGFIDFAKVFATLQEVLVQVHLDHTEGCFTLVVDLLLLHQSVALLDGFQDLLNDLGQFFAHVAGSLPDFLVALSVTVGRVVLDYVGGKSLSQYGDAIDILDQQVNAGMLQQDPKGSVLLCLQCVVKGTLSSQSVHLVRIEAFLQKLVHYALEQPWQGLILWLLVNA